MFHLMIYKAKDLPYLTNELHYAEYQSTPNA